MNEPLPVSEGWLTTLEASKIYGCSPRLMTWYCREGRVVGAMKCFTPITHYRIPEDFEVLPSCKPLGNPVNLEKYRLRKESQLKFPAWAIHGD